MPTDTNFYSGHRARLRQKFIDGQMANYEFLELLLSFVIPRRDVRPLSRALMNKYGGLYNICILPIDELTSVSGIGRNTAIFLKAIHHAITLEQKEFLDSRPIFHNDTILTNYCLLNLGGKTIEEFHVFYLDKDKRLLADDVHSVGTVDYSEVYPREIVRRALNLGASSVLLLHNHPHPDIPFSKPDIEMTTVVQELLRPFNITLYDHYLIAGNKIISAREKFLIH